MLPAICRPVVIELCMLVCLHDLLMEPGQEVCTPQSSDLEKTPPFFTAGEKENSGRIVPEERQIKILLEGNKYVRS